MASVRLVVVLALYAVLVAAALVTITVLFSVLSRQSMEDQVLRLARSDMSTFKQSTVNRITNAEISTYCIAMLLQRLSLLPSPEKGRQNIDEYVATWNIMTIPEMEQNSTYLSTFSMWLDTATHKWYMTECDREKQLCSLYNASSNTTQFVTYYRSNVMNPVDTSTVVKADGTPALYQRYIDSLSLQKTTLGHGWWSYVYIDYAESVATHICNDIEVAKTVDYFYCTAYHTLEEANASPTCKQLVGVTIEATEEDSYELNDYIASSTVYATSIITKDNVNGACNPDPDIQDAITKYLKRCKDGLLSNCTEYYELDKPYVYSVIGYSQANGVYFVIANRSPHSFFFGSIEHSQTVAIIISVVMIILVTMLSVIISLSIVVPISFICRSMKNASNLTYEPQMAPITRYTIFSEVKQLCASYLDLRQALKDLKAFMPQGLLVGPDEGVDSCALLSALVEGGHYTNGETDESGFNDDCENDDSDDGADESDQEEAGRAGGCSTSDATISSDTFVPKTETQRHFCATPACSALVSRDGVDNAVFDVNSSPLGSQCHRRNTHPTNFMSQNGIVSVVAIGTIDAALPTMAAEKAALPKSGSAATAVALSSGSAMQTRDVPRSQLPVPHKESQRIDVAIPSGKRVKFRNYDNDMTVESSKMDGALLRLNRSVYNGSINKFRNVNCTLVCIRFSFKFIDEHSLEGEVSRLMTILIRVILRYGGVIEVFRPDLIVVSFGAHAVMSLHTQRATAAAIVIMKKLTAAQRARTRIVIDTGSFYCGTCGANGRVSPVLFGNRFDTAVELLHYDLGQGRLVVTDRVALCLPADFVVPFDYLITLRDRSHGCQLFLVLNPAKCNRKDFRESVNEFRRAYTLVSRGRYGEALEIVSRGCVFDPELVSYCAATYKYLLAMNPPRPRYCRFQLPSFEPLGVTVKEQAPKYQHERLQLNELVAEEGNISINFGFNSTSSSCTAANVSDGGGHSPSRVFGEDLHKRSTHTDLNGDADHDEYDDDKVSVGADGTQSYNTGTPSGVQRARSRGFSRDSTATVRSFAADRTAYSEPSNCEHKGDTKTSFTHNIFRTGNMERTDFNEEGLPLVFVDHKGERWHRFPNRIGVGAFAEVYKAISDNGSLVALKCIPLASTNVQLADVVSEVNTACKLFSDFIVNHIGWTHVGSYIVIIMDFMSGGSLHSAMPAFPNGLTLQVARRYASDALRGLAYLHRNGVVHADFKPQNILLASDGGCRLSDFGSSVTKANARFSGGDVFYLRGTPAYMSPEVAKGDMPSMKSDMWSFGVTLYEILTGRLPWVMKKNTRPFTVPDGSSSVVRNSNSCSNVAPLPSSGISSDSTVAAVIEAAALKTVNDVYGVTNHHHHSTSTADVSGKSPRNNSDSVSASAHSIVASPFTVMVPPLTFQGSPVEWVPMERLSDARFVQGIANGSIRIRVEQKDLPTVEAYQLIEACLSESPQKRPNSWEIVDHPFFFSQQ